MKPITFRGKISALFAFFFVTLGFCLLAFTKLTSATAEINYLSVKQSDFAVVSNRTMSGAGFYAIQISYIGTNTTGLPQARSSKYKEQNVALETDDQEKLNLWYIMASSSSYVFDMVINLTYDQDGKIGYTKANPTLIRIPVGTKFTSSDSYTGDYGGIVFEDGLTLVLDESTKVWVCKASTDVSADDSSNDVSADSSSESSADVSSSDSSPENSSETSSDSSVDNPIDSSTESSSDSSTDSSETTPTVKEYSVILNETTVTAFGVNSDNLLEAKIAVPYALTTNVTYNGSFSAEVSGASYSGAIVVRQSANSKILSIIFNNSESICANVKNVNVTLKGGTLVNEQSYVKVKLSGEMTFYGYSDQSFSAKPYIEIYKTVEGVQTIEKVSVSQEVYVFEEVQTEADKIFFGWKADGELYSVGDTIDLTEYAETGLTIEAVCFDYGLLTGATIRCDKDLKTSGIRFSADLSKSDYLAYSSIIRGAGIIVMPNDLIGEKEFVLQNYNGQNQIKNFYAEASSFAFDQKGVFRLHASIVTVLESNYNRAFAARAYLVVNRDGKEEYLWGSQIQSRSVYEVATKALEENEKENDLTKNEITILEAYVNDVANITYDGTVATVVCAAQTPTITGVIVIKSGTLITITLTTSKATFAAVTYNGNRILGTVQAYQDGKLTISFEETVTE